MIPILGTEGADRLIGRHYDEVLYGGPRDDFLFGRCGDDRLHGGAGHDRLRGGTGHDEMFAGDGVNRLSGGDGMDRAWLDDSSRAFVHMGAGRDVVWIEDAQRVHAWGVNMAEDHFVLPDRHDGWRVIDQTYERAGGGGWQHDTVTVRRGATGQTVMLHFEDAEPGNPFGNPVYGAVPDLDTQYMWNMRYATQFWGGDPDGSAALFI